MQITLQANGVTIGKIVEALEALGVEVLTFTPTKSKVPQQQRTVERLKSATR